jgi:hypothetical protein
MSTSIPSTLSPLLPWVPESPHCPCRWLLLVFLVLQEEWITIGDVAMATSVYKEAVDVMHAKGGNVLGNVFIMTNLAVLLKAQHEYDAASALLEEALAIRRQALGLGHPDVLSNIEALIAVQKTNSPERCAQYFKLLVEAVQEYSGEHSEEAVRTMRRAGVGWAVVSCVIPCSLPMVCACG